MEKALIGFTGLVGSNLLEQVEFNQLYNRSNFKEMMEKEFDTIVCSGIRAEKFLANKDPETDWQQISVLLDVLEKVKAKNFVLISTVDVYKNPIEVDEDTKINPDEVDAYGKNRFLAEVFVKEHFTNSYILRLPALFGKGLKKNFIYDLNNIMPKMIMPDIWQNLSDKQILSVAYTKNDNDIYVLNQDITPEFKTNVEAALMKNNFTSLNFTDCDSLFQFYNLSYLWLDVSRAIKNNQKITNVTSEPISAKDIAKKFLNIDFTNKTNNKPPVKYDVYSKYGDEGKYLYEKDSVYSDLANYFKR